MNKVLAARKARKLTILEVAVQAKLNPSSVSRFERGIQGIRPAAAKRLGAVLGLDPAELVLMERDERAA